jgi:choline dehydrogenase-like flavoprotein
VHAGLFVADGSTIPGALAVNPTLSIVAQALRVAAAVV